jgi:thiamine pyrophosphokinase
MRVFIFLNGGGSRGEYYREHLNHTRRGGDLVFCANGGYELAHGLGIRPDRVVGDLDSVSPIVATGVEVARYPREKDFSDFELALQHATAEEPERVFVYGALGGRPDHLLTNIVVLAHAEIPVVFIEESAECYNVREELTIDGREGCTASLVAIGGTCSIRSTGGFRYPLVNEDLHPSSRGLSNVITARTARVRVSRGKLVVIVLREP